MFEAETQYTFQDLLALNTLSARTYQRGRSVLCRLLLGAVGVFFTLTGILMLREEGPAVQWVFVTAAGAWLLFTAIFTNYLNALRSRHMMVKDLGAMRYTFGEEEFVEACDKQTVSQRYGGLHSIFRFRERYFLFLDKKHAFILPRSAFLAGDLEEFERFLSEKCSREWNRLYSEKGPGRLLKS